MIRSRFAAFSNRFSSFSLLKFSRFSSFETNPKPALSFCHEDAEVKGSIVYQHKLLFQRPATLNLKEFQPKYAGLFNFVSFIGTVLFPLKTMESKYFGVYTILQVNSSRDSKDSFRVLLSMWMEIAEIASQHLKEKDFIYVSGYLRSYTKVDENGHLRIFYKVIVKELNYVARSGRPENNQQCNKLEPNSTYGRKMDNLYLWQVFFASPYEWWDNRNKKKNPKSPDFKHKDTGEVLWLSPSDPPWVSKQLKLHDSRMAERGYQDYGDSRSRLSMWKYDEY